MTSEIRTNSLKSRAGLSTVTLTDSGPIFSGITTFLDNSIFNVGNINATGIVTASSFKLSDGSTVGGAMTRDTQGNLFAGDTAGEDLNNSSGYNVLIGNKSGKNITSAQNNIFVGEETGESITGGSGNIAIGTKTLEFAGSGTSANVVIGYNAGQEVSGDSNTIVGNSASGGAMTGQNNLILGNGAARSASGISNEITLGNSSITKFRIPGLNFTNDNGKVLIGTTTEGLGTYGEDLTIGSSDHAGITLRTGTGHKGTIYFSDATSGADEYIGSLQYDHSDNTMRFRVNGTDRLYINSSGNFKVPDNGQLQFGGSLNSGNGDLQIYHDSGGNSFIKETGGGSLVINANDFYLQNVATTTLLRTHSSGQLDLSHNGNTRAYTGSDGFYISRVNTFSNPNNTGSETQGAMIDLGGNIHFKEIHPIGAYTDRCDLVLNTNSGYGAGLSDKIRITAGGRVVIYSSTQRTFNKGWAPGNLTLHNNSSDGTVDFTQGILFTDNANNQSDGGWMHAGIVCTGSSGYNGNICFGTDGNGVANNNTGGLTEKMRLSANGIVKIGSGAIGNTNIKGSSGTGNEGVYLDPGGPSQFAISNASVMALNRKTSEGRVFEVRYNGSVRGYLDTNGSSLPSDKNYKTDISDLSLGLSFVNKLKPSQFRFKDSESTSPILYGLIAQDVEESLTSEGVSQNSTQMLQYKVIADDDNESDYYLDYAKLTPVLINAVKELSTEIKKLEEDNITLRARVTALEGS